MHLVNRPSYIAVIANQDVPVGVEQEEAGEKWRAGDAAKSLRFFMRAINTYDEGLSKHPSAFDLAYNKYVIRHPISLLLYLLILAASISKLP